MTEENAQQNALLRSMLLEAIEDNREIEFSLGEHMYFATPLTDPPLSKCYGLLEVSEQKWLFKGRADDLLSFLISPGYTLNDDLEKFNIMYIL